MKYIDLQNQTPEEHYKTVKQLTNEGYHWIYSTFANPTFINESLETVTILSGIIEQDGYFAYSD